MVKIGWSGVRFLQEYRQNPNFQLIGAAYDCNLRAYLAKNDYQEGIESDADVYNTGMKIYTVDRSIGWLNTVCINSAIKLHIQLTIVIATSRAVYSKSPVPEMNELIKELDKNKEDQLPPYPFKKDFWDKILSG